jgi:hypothetical protein
MAAGDAIKVSGSYANNATCTFQPGSSLEGCLEQAFAVGLAELYHYDGTNTALVDTQQGPYLWSFFPALRCTNTDYYYLKNTSGVTALMFVSGVQTV